MDPVDKLTIDTPEQVGLEYHLAGLGSRFLALAFDTLLQFVLYFIAGLIAVFLMPDLGKFWPSAWNWTAAIFVLCGFTLYWGYFAIFEAIWKGQTPGKRHAGIRVITDSGRPIGVFEAIARNLVRVVDQFPGVYAVGVLTMFFSSKNRRLGDFVAGTVVVHESPQEGIRPDWETASKEPVSHQVQATALSIAEVELIETFLHRRIDLAIEVRSATARRIAGHITAKLQLQEPPSQSDEDFLETVVKQFRSLASYRET